MKSAKGKSKINKAITVIKATGMPSAQQNERSALCLLALINLTPRKSWKNAESPLIGITPIMDWMGDIDAQNWEGWPWLNHWR